MLYSPWTYFSWLPWHQSSAFFPYFTSCFFCPVFNLPILHLEVLVTEHRFSLLYLYSPLVISYSPIPFNTIDVMNSKFLSNSSWLSPLWVPNLYSQLPPQYTNFITGMHLTFNTPKTELMIFPTSNFSSFLLPLGKYHDLLIIAQNKYQKAKNSQGIWLAQSVKHATLDLGIVSSSPTLGTEFNLI